MNDELAAYARNTDPETSHEAVEAVAPALSRLEEVVMQALRRYPTGLCTKEIARYSGEDTWSISPRLRPLCNKGLVKDSGLTRENSKVWVLA